MNQKFSFNINWTKLLFGLLLIGVIIAALFFYSPIITYLLLALVFAYILDPLITWLEYKHIPRWISILLVYIVIGGLLTWLMMTLVPRLVDEVNKLIAVFSQSEKPLDETIKDLPLVRTMFDNVRELDSSIPNLGLTDKLNEFIKMTQDSITDIPRILMANYQKILGTIALIFTMPIFSFFILKDKKALRRGVLSLVPNRLYELSLILLDKIDETVGTYLRAMLLEVISVSIMSTIALTILGVPYSLVIGVLAGITNIIPYVGPWIGWAIAALTIVVTGLPLIMVVWVALAMLLVQQLDNYIVYPLVVGKTIKMHPLIVLLTVFAGGYFGGVIWMLISVPLVYIVYSLVRVLYINLKKFRFL